jgi:magnesium transporter
MVRRIPTASASDTVSQTLERLAGSSFDYADAVFIVDAQGRLQGFVPIARLFSATPDTPLGSIVHSKLPVVSPDTDQELVASIAIHEETPAMPVVDGAGKLLGVVPPVALLEILRREHVEDLHRLAGVTREDIRARHAIEAPPSRRARDRLPWLLVGLAGSVLATFVVAYFEEALQSRVAVAFFIPGIVYLADAVGTQTEAIAVRGISLSRLSVGRLIGGEIVTGLIIGATLALVAFAPVWLWFGDAKLAAAVSIALFVAGTVATTIGVLFPWLLSRLGRDPAYGSGPIGTIVQDVFSLVIYFITISVLVL